jgi:hypothetical protein
MTVGWKQEGSTNKPQSRQAIGGEEPEKVPLEISYSALLCENRAFQNKQQHLSPLVERLQVPGTYEVRIAKSFVNIKFLNLLALHEPENFPTHVLGGRARA